MATKKISELSTYTESSISDATQALVPLDDLTVVGTGKTKHMSFAEQAKWFGANLPKLVVNSGTLTASTPFTFSQTWNNVAVSFRGVKIAVTDSASAATSLPFEVLGGAGGVTNLLSARTDGVVQAGTEMRSPVFSTRSDSGEYRLGASDDLSMVRVAADHLGVRRGANAQSLSVFGTYTSASVYERLRLYFDGTRYAIQPEHVGGAYRDLELRNNAGLIGLRVRSSDATVYFPNGLVTESDRAYLWNTFGGIYQYSDGVYGFTSQATGAASRILFGPNNPSYPCIARNGTGLQIKLADNSALTGLEAKTFYATGGTLTASAPALDIAQTWNNGAVAFNAAKITIDDQASSSGSTAFHITGGAGGATNLLLLLKNGDLTCPYVRASVFSTSPSFYCADAGVFGFISGDCQLYRDAANHLALRNSTNAQSFSVYGSYTSGSVYERARLGWASSVFQVGTEHVGATARNLALITDGTPRLIFTADGASMTRTYAGSYSGPATNAPLRIQADASGYGFIIANSATEYTSFLSGGVYKGLVGTGSIPLLIQNVGGQIELQPSSSSSVLITGVQEMPEVSAPAAPSANRVKIYAEDNGSGKTRLMAIFPSGAAQQIAIEP